MIFLHLCDETPSVRKIRALFSTARGEGRGLRTDDISRHMYAPGTLGKHPGFKPGSVDVTKSEQPQGFLPGVGDDAGSPVRPTRPPSKEYSNKLRSETEVSDTTVPVWYESIRDFVTQAGLRQVRELSADELNCLARYHAYEWAYARKLTQNRAHSRAISAGIATLVSRNRAFANLTVGEYVRYGARLWEQGGKTPWFRATDIRAFER